LTKWHAETLVYSARAQLGAAKDLQMTPNNPKSSEAVSALTPKQYRVAQQNATERLGTGEHLDNHEPGEMEPDSSADEVSPDGVDGTETPATRKVGDIDEMAAHGPEGDGSIDIAAGDAQGIPKLPG